MNKESKQISLNKLKSELKRLAKPIDFSELEKKKIVAKEGIWYRIIDLAKLPIHAKIKAYEMVLDTKGLKVKFYKHSKFEQLLLKLENSTK